ncbi:MAG: RDD family protein [Bryobacteraceae bacterium]
MTAPPTAALETDVQPSLFFDPPPRPKVVPIPTLTPMRGQAGPRKTQPRGQTSRTGSSRRSEGDESQQTLNFHDAQVEIAPHADTVILCDAPVATTPHRLMAAAVDASMIAISLGLFLGVFLFAGGQVAMTKQTALLALGVIVAVGIFYRSLWSFGNGETPGMRFAGLRLVNFDGQIPGRKQRGIRQAAYLLSLLSVGVGLLWSLVDEEGLTWHDHISKTFPTPI